MWMPLSIEGFLNNAQFFGDSGAGEQLIDMQSVHTFEMVLKLTNVLTLARFPWQASESGVSTAILTGLIARRPVSSLWSGFHDVSNVMSISVSPRSEFILEKRLSLGLCLKLFPDHSALNRPTWVPRGFCLVLRTCNSTY